MKKSVVLFLFTFLFSNVSNDSLAVLIKDSNTELKKYSYQILEEVEYVDPLKGKKFGVELNPLYTILYNQYGPSLSGTFSLFNIVEKVEIAFPFSYRSRSDSTFTDSPTANLDVQYRYFLGKHREGFYIMPGLRFSYYKSGYYFDNIFDDDLEFRPSYNKQGVSFGIGYRIFSKEGWYWGFSLYLGKHYFGSVKDSDRFFSDSFINLELLKFGISF
ncbi:MAG: hypothetical protein CMG64_01495 [Candidatus Marinimicrobia bacterium]|nr:hypothetical protein [Candidatus Neomarinimicrobiota bacterium]|tara:strand:+ start:9903 stop:10550 length:648 start_codon:yes stop_codon:yes gene_type:complete